VKGDVLKGHLDMLLLAVVHDGATHGYAIIEELRARSGGRQRRVYAVTLTGRRLLTSRRQEWSAFTEAISGVLGGAS
jgi:DNA-binding PadR family transcriptional regulator